MTQYSGSFTLQQQAQALTSGQWCTDPYFKNTTLLLHADGVLNGSQNNTFLDSSSNAFAITRNGNTTQGSFSPYGNLWSNYFSGSDYFTTSGSFGAIGSGNFTIEAWVYPTSNTGNKAIVTVQPIASTGFEFYLQSGAVGWYTGGSTIAVSSATANLNQWNHIAAVRNGTTLTLYLNGISVATASNSTNYTQSSAYLFSDPSSQNFAGYASNLRVVIGTAIYTGTFTPSTTPLTAVSGTSLLTCQSNRFIDNSTNAFALTVNGSPSVQQFQPFMKPYQYSASVIGGSGYFDGSGDYLTVAGNPANNLSSGTIQAWVYVPSVTRQYIFTKQVDGTGSYCCLSIGYTLSSGGQASAGTAGKVYFHSQNSVTNAVSNSTISANTWVHIAAVFTTSNCKIYINGVLDSTTNGDYSIPNVASPTFTGIAASNSGADFTGYIAGLQLSNTALTPSLPTAPSSSDANTILLCNFTNAGIYDNAMQNNLETVGNAQVSTSVVKYGTGSLYFDGSGDYLNVPSTQNVNFGTGNFTIEFWAYWAGGSFSTYNFAFDSRSGNSPYTDGVGIAANITNGYWYISFAGQELITSTAATAGWQHIALVRNNGVFTLYINGTSGGTYTATNNMTNTTAVIGTYYAKSQYYWNGYIDDLRITNGVARYTANFQPPQVAFANQ